MESHDESIGSIKMKINNIEKKTQSKPENFFTKHKITTSSDENIQTGESIESLSNKIAKTMSKSSLQ